jgi:hypothetical protein
MSEEEKKVTEPTAMYDLIKTLNSATRLIKFSIWIFNAGKYILFLGSLIGAAWMSLLLIYIWTGNLLLLKVWATPIAVGLVLMLIIDAFSKLTKKKRVIKLLNHEEVFGNGVGVKYVVIDEKDPNKGQEVTLYPIYGRLINDGVQINFFHEGQIKEVKESE